MSEIKLKPCPFCGGDKLKIDSKTKHISYRNINKFTVSVRCNKCHARGGTVSGEVSDHWGHPESTKLTTYKELEAKAIEAWNRRDGLLLRLPCKVGDTAYHVIRDRIAKPPIYISEHEIKDVSANAVYFADDWWSFEEMRELNVFLIREEAEQALKEGVSNG